MGTCETCKYWDENLPQSIEDVELGYEVHPFYTFGWGKCKIAESHNGNIGTFPLLAMDAETYHAHLITRPSFGCNQYEAK